MIDGFDIKQAMIASAEQARGPNPRDGIERALRELGVDAETTMTFLSRDSLEWLKFLPVFDLTLGDVARVIASAESVALTAGIRLGRLTAEASPAAGRDDDPRAGE